MLRVRQLAVAICKQYAAEEEAAAAAERAKDDEFGRQRTDRAKQLIAVNADAMDRELLIEIGVEEIPASWLPALTDAGRARGSRRG